MKFGGSRGKGEKFGGTPDHCFIWNDSVDSVGVPDKLDRAWYITEAKKRLESFGMKV